MDLIQLNYFMRVASSHNFTRAAKEVFTSQSNVSKQISKLETELGVTLFERKNVGVGLTEAGELLYQGLLELEPKFNELIAQTKDICKKNKGSLKIGFSDSMDFNRIMPQVFEEIINNEESLNIEVLAYPIDKVNEKLLEKEIDVAISFNLVEIDSPNVTRHPISRTNSFIYYSKKNPLYLKKNLQIEDFKDEVFYLLDNPVRKKEFNPLLYLPFTPKEVIKLSTVNAIILNIERGRGITVFGQSHSFFGKASLETFSLDYDKLIVGADAVWLNDNQNPNLSIFLKYLQESLILSEFKTRDQTMKMPG